MFNKSTNLQEKSYLKLSVSISIPERILSFEKNLFAALLFKSISSKSIFNSLSLDNLLSPSDIMSMLVVDMYLLSLQTK